MIHPADWTLRKERRKLAHSHHQIGQAPLTRRVLISASAALAGFLVLFASAAAQEQPTLPPTITFATSTGYWTDEVQQPASGQQTPSRHGYYKLYAVRQADGTSKIYLQKIAATETGPQVLSTTEIGEINELRPYVTDLSPENSDGPIDQPGLFATVTLRADLDGEVQRWRVAMDEFGEISVERPTE